ncbi:MAG: HAD family phosphatase [Verrucomicrobiales bacterium]|nr:HAD family phosphatase [Verrucomicrobiales bacterium]
MPDHLPSPFGVVFDLDGVIIDSHDQHKRSWFQLAEQLGLTLTKEQFKESFGMRNEMCIPDVFGWTTREETDRISELGDRKEEIYRTLLSEGGLSPLPGVVALVSSLNAAEIPMSLGSSTSRKNIEVCFATTGLAQFFGLNYTGAEDVSKGKPAPDVFLEAARKIERAPENCIVIEDAHVGLEAALSAGMKSIAVTTTHPRESFSDSGAALIVDSLEEISAATIEELLIA